MNSPAATRRAATGGPSEANRQAIHAWYLGFIRRVLTDSGLAPLRPLFAADAVTLNDFNALCRHQVKIMDLVARSQNAALVAGIVAAMDAYSREEWGAALPEDADPDGTARAAVDLARDGFVRLSPVDDGIVAALRSYFERQDVFDDNRLVPCAMGETGDWYRAHFPTTTVVASPGLVELANDPRLLILAARHLGAVPTILGYAAWWSFAGRDRPFDEQYYHRDLADFRFCKLFLYLTDVDMDSGPHAFVPGTHDPVRMAALAASWQGGPQAFRDWFFRSLRKTDAETHAHLGIDPVLLDGPAGTLFLADTRGIHKGMVPRTRNRLVCQVVYGVSANMQRPRDVTHPFPARVGTGPAVTAPAAATMPPLAFVNRFYLAPAEATP